MQVTASEQGCRPSRNITPTVMFATICRGWIDGAMRMDNRFLRSVFKLV